jgi:hypothetical protein
MIISNGLYNFSLAVSNHSALKSLSLQTCDTSTNLPPGAFQITMATLITID